MTATHCQTRLNKGTANAASSRGSGTNPNDSNNAAAKAGLGLERARSNAANANIASAYQGNSGTPASRNCGSGSACHQSIATHSNSQTRLRPISTYFEGLKLGIPVLKVHNRSSNVKERCGLAGAGTGARFGISFSSIARS